MAKRLGELWEGMRESNPKAHVTISMVVVGKHFTFLLSVVSWDIST